MKSSLVVETLIVRLQEGGLYTMTPREDSEIVLYLGGRRYLQGRQYNDNTHNAIQSRATSSSDFLLHRKEL